MHTILYEPKGAVVRITLNRPQAMNAFDLPTARELGRRLEEFDRDDALRVAIVTGAGDKSFCAGADLKQMHGGSHAGGIDELWGSEIQYRLGQRLQVTKPVIAAINGYCLAGGLELALGCDLRIASDDARFGIPAARLGLGYHYNGMEKLMALVGPSVTKEIFFTARTDWTAQDASELYEVARWGKGYFSVGADGHLLVHPTKDPSRAIDLKQLVDHLQLRGISLPTLIRFSDILKHRLRDISDAFQSAIAQHNYGGNKAAAARLLGLDRKTLYRKLQAFGARDD